MAANMATSGVSVRVRRDWTGALMARDIGSEVPRLLAQTRSSFWQGLAGRLGRDRGRRPPCCAKPPRTTPHARRGV